MPDKKVFVKTRLNIIKTIFRKLVDEYQLPFGMLINWADFVEWLMPKIIQIAVGAI